MASTLPLPAQTQQQTQQETQEQTQNLDSGSIDAAQSRANLNEKVADELGSQNRQPTGPCESCTGCGGCGAKTEMDRIMQEQKDSIGSTSVSHATTNNQMGGTVGAEFTTSTDADIYQVNATGGEVEMDQGAVSSSTDMTPEATYTQQREVSTGEPVASKEQEVRREQPKAGCSEGGCNGCDQCGAKKEMDRIMGEQAEKIGNGQERAAAVVVGEADDLGVKVDADPDLNLDNQGAEVENQIETSNDSSAADLAADAAPASQASAQETASQQGSTVESGTPQSSPQGEQVLEKTPTEQIASAQVERVLEAVSQQASEIGHAVNVISQAQATAAVSASSEGTRVDTSTTQVDVNNQSLNEALQVETTKQVVTAALRDSAIENAQAVEAAVPAVKQLATLLKEAAESGGMNSVAEKIVEETLSKVAEAAVEPEKLKPAIDAAAVAKSEVSAEPNDRTALQISNEVADLLAKNPEVAKEIPAVVEQMSQAQNGVQAKEEVARVQCEQITSALESMVQQNQADQRAPQAVQAIVKVLSAQSEAPTQAAQSQVAQSAPVSNVVQQNVAQQASSFTQPVMTPHQQASSSAQAVTSQVSRPATSVQSGVKVEVAPKVAQANSPSATEVTKVVNRVPNEISQLTKNNQTPTADNIAKALENAVANGEIQLDGKVDIKQLSAEIEQAIKEGATPNEIDQLIQKAVEAQAADQSKNPDQAQETVARGVQVEVEQVVNKVAAELTQLVKAGESLSADSVMNALEKAIASGEIKLEGELDAKQLSADIEQAIKDGATQKEIEQIIQKTIDAQVEVKSAQHATFEAKVSLMNAVERREAMIQNIEVMKAAIAQNGGVPTAELLTAMSNLVLLMKAEGTLTEADVKQIMSQIEMLKATKKAKKKGKDALEDGEITMEQKKQIVQELAELFGGMDSIGEDVIAGMGTDPQQEKGLVASDNSPVEAEGQSGEMMVASTSSGPGGSIDTEQSEIKNLGDKFGDEIDDEELYFDEEEGETLSQEEPLQIGYQPVNKLKRDVNGKGTTRGPKASMPTTAA